MKKRKKLLLFALILVPVGGFVCYQMLNKTSAPEWHTTPFNPDETVEIAMTRKAVVDKFQRLDAPDMPKHIVKRLVGKEDILTERLNRTLTDMEDLLLEVRSALIDGRAKIGTDMHGLHYGIIETSTAKINISMLASDGTFRQCTKIFYANSNEVKNGTQKKEKLVFRGDNRILKYYKGTEGYVSFFEDGNFEIFSTVIDDKNHYITWHANGKINFYKILDVSNKSAGN